MSRDDVKSNGQSQSDYYLHSSFFTTRLFDANFLVKSYRIYVDQSLSGLDNASMNVQRRNENEKLKDT